MKTKSPALANAAEYQRQHPVTFQRPTVAELDAITVGDLVKVCHNAERFWVEVTKRAEEFFSGKVNHPLIFGTLQCGERIKFHTDNIFDITRKAVAA